MKGGGRAERKRGRSKKVGGGGGVPGGVGESKGRNYI